MGRRRRRRQNRKKKRTEGRMERDKARLATFAPSRDENSHLSVVLEMRRVCLIELRPEQQMKMVLLLV